MNDPATLQHCLTYVETQLGSQPRPGSYRRPPPPTVTISRAAGTGAIPIADRLAAYLQQHRPASPAPWTVFHRALVERMLAEHNLPERLARYMPEGRVSYIQDTLEELLGLHPSSTDLVTRISQTILGLAEIGHCILVGRGGNVILAGTPTAFHVRLIGTHDRRVRRVTEERQLTEVAAADFVRHEDQARARYLKTQFDKDTEDPLGYHLVVNTDWFSPDEAAELIGAALLRHFPAEP